VIETRKKWQGQTVDAKFVLGEYLGGSNNTAVFLTQHGDSTAQKAVIKLMPADPASADRQLSLWRRAAQLSHPNLVSLLQFGRCLFQNTDMLYVVMEYQEENLAQILPQRPLAPAEARGLLEPVLAALAWLHSQGLAHGRFKPANILATGDQIKLSSDSVSPIGEPRSSLEETTAYDAPESPTAPLSSVADVWSLGVTLVEALTLRAPTLQNAEHILPESLPSPFLEIARHSLRIDPARRWTTAEIAACLNPDSAKPAATPSAASPTAPSTVSPASNSAIPPKASSVVSASPAAAAPSSSGAKLAPPRSAASPPQQAMPVILTSPLAVPLSPVPPLPRQQMPRETDTRPPATSSSTQSGSNSRNLVLGAVVFIVVIAIFAASKFLGHHDAAPPATTAAASSDSAKPIVQPSPQPPAKSSSASSAAPASPAQTKTSQPATANSLKTASEKEALAKEDRSSFSVSSAAPPASASSSNSGGHSARGEVLDQVLPEVSQKARDTIHGKVRVVVRVHVDPSGNVSAADLDSPSPSKFFADLALQAARRWEFQSPEADGHSLPSEWLLRFEFTPTDTQVFPKQQVP
jgi:TonB family protein